MVLNSSSSSMSATMFRDPKGEISITITKEDYNDMVHCYVESWFDIQTFNPRRSAAETVFKYERKVEAALKAFDLHPPKNKNQEEFKRQYLFDLYEDLKSAKEQLAMIDNWEKEVHRWVLILERLVPVEA